MNNHASLIGRILSTLIRAASRLNSDLPATRNGLPVLSSERPARFVTLELVNQLRDEMPL